MYYNIEISSEFLKYFQIKYGQPTRVVVITESIFMVIIIDAGT